MPFTEYRYELGGRTYLKRWDCARGQYAVLREGVPVSAAEWNRVTGDAWSVTNRLDHPVFLIRWIERHRCQVTRRLAGRGPRGRILDVGCETGHLSAALVHGCRLGVLADLSWARLVEARPRVRSNVGLMAADLFHLPCARGSFDLVTCTEVLEHLSDPPAAIKEIARVLAPGGRVVVSVPNDRLIVGLKRLMLAIGLGSVIGPLSPDLSPDHLQLFSRRSLRRLLEPAFSVRELFLSSPFGLHLFAEGVRRS